MKNNILWKLEQDFKEQLEYARNRAIYDEITIKELLDLGFNNNYLIINDKEVKLGYIDLNGNYSLDLSEEQLNVKVYMKEDFGWYDDEDTDSDSYHIAKVYCFNKFDEKLFEE